MSCNFWRTFLCGATAMLSGSEPDGDGEGDGALRFAIARDVKIVNDKERFAMKLTCVNCVVLFAVTDKSSRVHESSRVHDSRVAGGRAAR